MRCSVCSVTKELHFIIYEASPFHPSNLVICGLVKSTRGVERRLFIDILAQCCFLLRHRFLTLFWPWVVGYFGQIYFTVNLLSLLIWAGRSHLHSICPCSFLWLFRLTQLSQTALFADISRHNKQTNKSPIFYLFKATAYVLWSWKFYPHL